MKEFALPEIVPAAREAFARKLLAWYRQVRRDLPWRREVTPYRVVVSETMCQQTQIATVIPYFERWMKRFPDWRTLAAASEAEVLKLWEGLGYYRRARGLHQLSREVAGRGELPEDVEALRELPGIGPYTGAAVASIAFGKRHAVLDGNVMRVLCRFFDLSWDCATPASRKALQKLADELIPEKDCGDYNQAIMELGALVCRPGKPDCLKCPIRKNCRAEAPEKLPVITRQSFITQQEELALICKGGKILLVSPVKAIRWRGMYRLPTFDLATMRKEKELGGFSYTVTRHHIQAVVFFAEILIKKLPDGRWFTLSAFESLPLPVPHRKMIQAFFKGVGLAK